MRNEVRFLCEKFTASGVLTPKVGLPAPCIFVVGQDALAKYLVDLSYASEIFLKFRDCRMHYLKAASLIDISLTSSEFISVARNSVVMIRLGLRLLILLLLIEGMKEVVLGLYLKVQFFSCSRHIKSICLLFCSRSLMLIIFLHTCCIIDRETTV